MALSQFFIWPDMPLIHATHQHLSCTHLKRLRGARSKSDARWFRFARKLSSLVFLGFGNTAYDEWKMDDANLTSWYLNRFTHSI